jgi:hypothetical protein
MLISQRELKLQKVRKDLTLELFLRCGPFWEAVREERERWHIDEPRKYVPVRQEDLELIGARTPQPGEDNSGPAVERWYGWGYSLIALHDRAIPSDIWPFRVSGFSFLAWDSFLAQCLLFDPPPLQLLEFAHVELAGAAGQRAVESDSFSGTSARTHSESIRSRTVPVHPALVHWADADEAMRVEQALWSGVLDELAQRFLIPQGIDLDVVLQEIYEETTLWQDYGEAVLNIPTDVLIAVSSGTTQEDVVSAFQVLAAHRSRPAKGGRPPVDDLMAVECANRKRAGWTYRQISDHYGFPMSPDSYDKKRRANSAIALVKRGEDLIRSRENSSE